MASRNGDEQETDAVTDELALRARELVHGWYASEDGCSTSAIAGALGVSGSLLCHHYRAAFGVTIGSEIRRLRIDLALRLLADDPGRLIKEVAAEAGYSKSSYRTFLNAFQQETGLSPTEYQKCVLLGQPVDGAHATAAQEQEPETRRLSAAGRARD